MKFNTLYTLDSKGKIRIFECEVNNTLIITRTGLLGGKLIEKVDNVRSGKQKRSVEQQAEFQAKSLWTEKLDEGYKSYKMLLENLVIEDASNLTIIDVLKKLPKSSYTNSNWDELPMLAHKYKDIKNPIFPMYAQPKLDGVRCIVKKGSFGTVKLCSRGGQYYIIKHIEQQLGNLFDVLVESSITDNLIFDGEIYVHGVPLQDISGAARREDDSIDMFKQASNSWLEYHIYDVINLNNLKETQKQRFESLIALKLILSTLNLSHISIVDTVHVLDNKEVNVLHDKFISEGYEGLILRSPEGMYEFNNRSKNLLKVKQYQDEEFEIIGYEMESGFAESFVFKLQNNVNELTFLAKPTGTLQQRRDWYENIEHYIGKKATVRFFIRSKDGLPLQGSVQHKISPILIKHIRPNGE